MAIVENKKSAKSQNKNHQAPSRLNFRLAPEVKARVARAAALAGQDLTEFAVVTLSEKADEIIERHETVFLKQEDYNFFLNALENNESAEPSERSRAAAERYRRGKRTGASRSLVD